MYRDHFPVYGRSMRGWVVEAGIVYRLGQQRRGEILIYAIPGPFLITAVGGQALGTVLFLQANQRVADIKRDSGHIRCTYAQK